MIALVTGDDGKVGPAGLPGKRGTCGNKGQAGVNGKPGKRGKISTFYFWIQLSTIFVPPQLLSLP